MKSVGDRIRQAREFRKLSTEELARRVGYKTQSGISNLENRATGRGGFMLPKIAEALDVSLDWLLQGPDTEQMSQVARFHTSVVASEYTSSYSVNGAEDVRGRAHQLVERINEKGLLAAIEILEALADRHPADSTGRAGLSIPASTVKAA